MSEKDMEKDMLFWEKIATRQAKALKDLETGREGMVLIKLLQQNMDFQDRKIEKIEATLKEINTLLSNKKEAGKNGWGEEQLKENVANLNYLAEKRIKELEIELTQKKEVEQEVEILKFTINRAVKQLTELKAENPKIDRIIEIREKLKDA